MRIKIIKPWLQKIVGKDVVAITFYPFGMYVTQKLLNSTFSNIGYNDNHETIRHEVTHWLQEREMLCIPFYIWYGLEYLIKLPFYGKEEAYYNISFEREAYKNETLDTYNQTRPHFAWFKYII